MAFLHLLNCLLLTYAPVFLVYNATALQDSGVQICLGGFGGFLLSSILKLLAYATIIPMTEDFNIFSELLKEAVSIIDLVMIRRVFTWKFSRTTDKKTRVLGVGLGWAAAEIFFSHFLIFVVNAGGGEFSWEYLQRAINANFYLFQGIALVGLVAAFEVTHGASKIVIAVLVACQSIVKPVLISAALNYGSLNEWTGIVAQGVWTLGFIALGKALS